MMIRNKVGNELLFYRYLPIKIFLGIILTMKRWYSEFNFSLRIIIINIAMIAMIVVINITSHTYMIMLRTST